MGHRYTQMKCTDFGLLLSVAICAPAVAEKFELSFISQGARRVRSASLPIGIGIVRGLFLVLLEQAVEQIAGAAVAAAVE